MFEYVIVDTSGIEGYLRYLVSDVPGFWGINSVVEARLPSWFDFSDESLNSLWSEYSRTLKSYEALVFRVGFIGYERFEIISEDVKKYKVESFGMTHVGGKYSLYGLSGRYICNVDRVSTIYDMVRATAGNYLYAVGSNGCKVYKLRSMGIYKNDYCHHNLFSFSACRYLIMARK